MIARIVTALFLLLGATPAVAAAPTDAGPFAAGSVRVAASLGLGRGYDESYLIVGADVGYYVVDGLEVGAGADFWLLGDPFIATAGPQVRYVLHFVPYLKPYVGALYKHRFVSDGFPDADIIGGRAGAFYVTGGGSYFGGGVVVERIVSDCDTDCTFIGPELALSLSF